MKKIFYRLFALLFNLYTILTVRKNRISLLAPHPESEHDSLRELKRYIESKGGYDIREISVPRGSVTGFIGFILNKSRILATSEYIFLNDNFMPMADMKFKKGTVVTQLWHGEGAFKKFGLATDIPDEIAQRLIKCTGRLDCIVTTSQNVNSVYAEAFGADESKIKALGSPRCDFLIRNRNSTDLRRSFDEIYPEAKGKKLILYAPTFRDNDEADGRLLSETDFKYLKNELGDEYALLIKLHPRIHSSVIPEGLINVTDYDINELTVISDMLITDYSSVCMNFALLSKPCIFYAFDLDEFKNDRSFYYDYKSYVPGPVITDYRDLPGEIKNSRTSEKCTGFRNFNFDYLDDKSSQRIYEAIISSSLQ